MKNLYLLATLLFGNYLFGQIIDESPIVDLSDIPPYESMTEIQNGVRVWNKEFKYIDEIDMSWITYKSDELKISGLLVKPKKDGNYPCIIYNRGGNRNYGALSNAVAARRMGFLANQGYIVIASNYRGAGNSEGEDEFGGKDVNDILNLIPALEDVEGANTEKIGMYGWSRGGMMTYLALTKTNKIDAAIVGAARSDLRIIDRPGKESKVYAECIPNYWDNKEEELTKRSAITWADKFSKEVPILMLHGNADWRVKSTNSLKLALEFEEHRIPYRLKIYEGADHSISEFRQDVQEEVVYWFDTYLKKEGNFPNMEYHGR